MAAQFDIDATLDKMMMRESGGQPNARGKAGEIGLLQVKPEVAQQYGIDPEYLTNPVVNRYVAKRYLTDLLSQFQNDPTKAIEAYNAGPGNIRKGIVPLSTRAYVSYVLGDGASKPSLTGLPIQQTQYEPSTPQKTAGFRWPSFGGTAYAEDVPPASMIPEGKYRDFTNGKTYTNRGGKIIEVPKGSAKPEPFPVKAAGYLPMVGQFIGEPLGAMAGAAIPGAGESGIPEYAGAVAGGGAGSALGAKGENAIRNAYGLPPVDVGSEAAWGAGGSAIGGLIPGFQRFRKAARIAKQTGKSFSEAMEMAGKVGAQLESTLGMGPRVGKILEQAPSTPLQNAYQKTYQVGADELGDAYNQVLRPFNFRMAPATAGRAALAGAPGRNLEMAGKSLRTEVEEEFAHTPKTVAGVQRLIRLVKAKARTLNPDRDKAALAALQDIQKALESDRDKVIGQHAAAAIKNIDYHYARQIRRFPLSRVRSAMTLPQAAEEILASKPGDTGRVVEVINEMRKAGHIVDLQKGTAARIFQKAGLDQSYSEADKLARLEKAINSIDSTKFDALYGMGAKKTWLETAKTVSKRSRELLDHPSEAMAIEHEVQKYLESPTMIAGMMTHYLKHRVLFEALLLGAGAYNGELGAAAGAIVGLECYEMVAHSRPAMALLRRAATQKAPKAAARMVIAALNAAIRTEAEGQSDAGR